MTHAASGRQPAPQGRGTASTHLWLQRRIVLALLLASLLPLALTGVGSWLVFGKMIEQRALDLHQEVVRSHANAIEQYLDERLRALEAASRTQSLEALVAEGNLARLLRELNQTYQGTFVDLGVIGADGRHRAYAGPFDLVHRNYADSEWFRYVMVRGSFVSDVFLGFREVPHCVIAVKHDEGQGPWVLRATIDSQKFDALVRTANLGATGDAFLVNVRGVYQTPPRDGHVMDRSLIDTPQPHSGVRHARVRGADGATLLRATTWINHPRWMLVVQQAEDEIEAPVRQATVWGAVVVALGVLLMLVTTVVATRHLSSKIEEAQRQNEALAQDLLRSAKLASLGELATGLAHEINNPLAIISAEDTNLSDLLLQLDPAATPTRDEMLESVERIKKQVLRGGAITAKMLQFGRHGASAPELFELGPRLAETVELLQRQARLRNIDLSLSVESELPPVRLDPTELQQVLVNLINNSLQALRQGGSVEVEARRTGNEVELSVRDDGPGIPEHDLDKVFLPFFTTKPVGQGTGLGLSVCYGLVQSWGGIIEAESQRGTGTTMRIRIPVPQATAQKQFTGEVA